MFLDLTMRRNPRLIEAAFKLHQRGMIEPDTYVIDLDAVISNSRAIKEEADKYGVKLYFMTKQFGRNPVVSKELMKLGYEGAVAVDYREAEILAEAGIKLGHAGHLVQLPSGEVEKMLLKKPEVITVYSVEKAREISKAAVDLGMNQNIMLRVLDKDDTLYPAQYGGFNLEKLSGAVEEIMKLTGIALYGVTSFPCFLYDEKTGTIKETNNLKTVLRAKDALENKYGIKLMQINTPSATCTSSIKMIAENGGTHGEPGHGLLGTTPLHAAHDEVEIPAMVYVSEVSHNLGSESYCYGGGHYRRSHMKSALVGKDTKSMKRVEVGMPDCESIDYYIELKENTNVSDTVVMSFRTQVFVTRSEVAVVRGISSGNPEVAGIYDSQGRKIREV